MRFGFGKNWKSFLNTINDQRIAESICAIQKVFSRSEFNQLKVLDIGSGSGLSSLAFHKLGADVVAFDYDPQSVECTRMLKTHFAAESNKWEILQGSILDKKFIETLGKFDIVYSWGVLHHTGAMWDALTNSTTLLKPNGHLMIAIYNDQGWISKTWKSVKKLYCSGRAGSFIVKALFYPYFMGASLFRDIINFKLPFHHVRTYYKSRGMSAFHDWNDWLGGYPYEVASPQAIESFLGKYGLVLEKKFIRKSLGCNEFLFKKL